MKKIIFFGLISLLFFLNCSFTIAEEYNLDDLSLPLSIPSNLDSIKLTRGGYSHELTRIEALKNKKFLVTEIDVLKFDSTHQDSPEDAYSRIITAFPADDKSAMRGYKNFHEGTWEIKSPQEMADAQTLMEDTNHLNSVKFSFGILPTDDKVRVTSRDIGVGSIIAISGTHYKNSGSWKYGQREPLTMCLSSIDVIYARELKIE